MAIIHGGSVCAICEGPLDRPYTATSGCAFVRGHELFPFCDAPLHLDCLEGWPRREAFARGYFDIGLESYRAGYGTLLHLDPTWFLACGPAKRPERPYFAELCPIDWPFRLYTRFEEWDAFLLGVYAEGLTGMALDRAKEVMARVTGLVPDQAALDNLYSTRAA